MARDGGVFYWKWMADKPGDEENTKEDNQSALGSLRKVSLKSMCTMHVKYDRLVTPMESCSSALSSSHPQRLATLARRFM